MNSGQRLFCIVRGQPRTLLLIVGLFLALPAVHGPVLAAQSGLQSTGQPDTLPLSLPGTAFTDDRRDAFHNFDRFVEEIMEDWQIPGAAIGVIHDGEIILARGFGHRDIDRRLPVTEHTTMAIGSNSKSFTVTLMAMLVDEGHIGLGRPGQ